MKPRRKKEFRCPIKLDTNGYGHIIVDQNSGGDAPFGSRVILTQKQVEAIAEYANKLKRKVSGASEW